MPQLSFFVSELLRVDHGLASSAKIDEGTRVVDLLEDARDLLPHNDLFLVHAGLGSFQQRGELRTGCLIGVALVQFVDVSGLIHAI